MWIHPSIHLFGILSFSLVSRLLTWACGHKHYTSLYIKRARSSSSFWGTNHTSNPHLLQIQGLSQQISSSRVVATLFHRFLRVDVNSCAIKPRPLSVFTTPVPGPSVRPSFASLASAQLCPRWPRELTGTRFIGWLGRSDEVIKSGVSCCGSRLRLVDGSSRGCPKI